MTRSRSENMSRRSASAGGSAGMRPPGGWVSERRGISGVAHEGEQLSRPRTVGREALEQLLEAVLDPSFDTLSQQERLGDLFDGLLDVIGGVTVASSEEEFRSVHVLTRARGMRGLASQRS